MHDLLLVAHVLIKRNRCKIWDKIKERDIRGNKILVKIRRSNNILMITYCHTLCLMTNYPIITKVSLVI